MTSVISTAHSLEDGARALKDSQGLVVVKGSQDDGNCGREARELFIISMPVPSGSYGRPRLSNPGAHEVGATHRCCDRTSSTTSKTRRVRRFRQYRAGRSHDRRRAAMRASIHSRFILTVRRADASDAILLPGQPIHRVLRGRILRVLLRRGLPRSHASERSATKAWAVNTR